MEYGYVRNNFHRRTVLSSLSQIFIIFFSGIYEKKKLFVLHFKIKKKKMEQKTEKSFSTLIH